MSSIEQDGSSSRKRWPDLAGRIEGSHHVLPIRVYFEDTDFTGLVYHTSYLRWCERGRSDFIRLLGLQHHDLLQPKEGGEPAVFVVRRMEVDYLRPARIDDCLEVTTECAEIGKVVLVLAQKVVRQNEILARLRVEIVLLSHSGKPRRLGKRMEQYFQHVRTDAK